MASGKPGGVLGGVLGEEGVCKDPRGVGEVLGEAGGGAFKVGDLGLRIVQELNFSTF